MLSSQPVHIDLIFPRSWNACTTEQLELIAATIVRHTEMAGMYHPFDWLKVKTELFFQLTGLTIVSEKNEPVDNDPEHQHRVFTVRRHKHEPAFQLQSWQVLSWVDSQMAWIDDKKAQPLIIFPYKRLFSAWHWQRKFPFVKKEYFAPGELLQNFSWTEYRHLQDYMELYVRIQNQALKTRKGVADMTKLKQLDKEMQTARNNFVRVLFKLNGPKSRNVRISKKIDNIRWQVILFWWSGMMRYLQKEYPHCFKQSTKKSSRRPHNPLELYTNIIVTIQAEAHLSEKEINDHTFHVILGQLERIARQAEKMEKLDNKHK